MVGSTLEDRVTALEIEVTRLRAKIETRVDPVPWWKKIRGTFANDPMYEEAMRLGRKYRESLRPGKPKRRKA